MKKIAILHSDVTAGSSKDEIDCLEQARAISQALRSLDYECALLPFSLDLKQTMDKLNTLKPDVVFNIVETVGGRGSLVYFSPAILDAMQFPYTGCGTRAMWETSNKPLSKTIMRRAGIATPDWITPDSPKLTSAPAPTYIIKSSWEHASIGLSPDSLVSHSGIKNLLKEISARREKLGGESYAEAYIDGREFNISLLSSPSGVKALPAAEIIFQNYAPGKPKLVDYNAKWEENSFEYNNTLRTYDFTRSDDKLLKHLREISIRCWEVFGLRGYARVDFRVDSNNKPWVLEINANPCLSQDAGFAAALEEAKIEYPEAMEMIVADALREKRFT
ncbi:MAG TPA: D-alanine--D-alanine ligase [Deltaproteobacteria bacterium]|nr:D-alanine--D-alanine ligase [Deltaproteobacteria bacterium]